MFNKAIDLEFLNNLGQNNICSLLGIEYTEIGPDYIIAKMPVDHRTHQPFGILHGGASVVLAESLGSIASYMCLSDTNQQRAVGLEINANHIRPISEGWVFGKVTPIHIGKKTHVWSIEITDQAHKIICTSRITVMII
jgi:1,4-dihydroxy-2-naphthoyl-CoA hydrolase